MIPIQAETVINGKLYVAGGMNASNTAPTSTLRSYDEVTNAWTTLAPMSMSMSMARAAAARRSSHGILYIAGGTTETKDI